jgi:U4/U6 small nuclear ribonucleoprotein PRP31
VSAKCALAARVDSCHESVDGSYGDQFRTDIEGKLDKLQEPPPVKQAKALPAPIDQARKKRGGRRYVYIVFMVKIFDCFKYLALNFMG